MNNFRSRIAALRVLLALALAAWAGLGASAGDWPQFLGPQRDGVSAERIATGWPKEGPPVVWQKTVGQGFSGPVVAGERLIFFHRLADQETVDCLDARSGAQLWRFQYPTTYRDDFGFDEGPRATPAIADAKVFTYGADGLIHSLDLATGKKLWSVDAKETYGSRKGFFGRVCSPLVAGQRVILNLGGTSGAGIAALDCATGNLAWKATEDEASYSSPILASLNGEQCIVALTRERLVALKPSDGAARFSYPYRPPMNASVTAAAPLVISNLVFLSASYQTGALLLDAQGFKPKEVWSSDNALSSHYASVVHHEGFLYGFHGRQEETPALRCIELKTGKTRWSKERFGAGTVTLAGGRLLVLLEDGRLFSAPASPKEFEPEDSAQILPFGVRAYPALANGLFYARSKNRLVCADLRPAQ